MIGGYTCNPAHADTWWNLSYRNAEVRTIKHRDTGMGSRYEMTFDPTGLTETMGEITTISCVVGCSGSSWTDYQRVQCPS